MITYVFFLTLWLYYCVRRENRVIGTLLRDTRDAEISTVDLVFSGIVSYMVFTAITPRKSEMPTLVDPRFDAPVDDSAHDLPTGPQKFKGVQLLFWLSPIAITFSLGLDYLSIFYFDAPFRISHHIPFPTEGPVLAKLMAFTLVGIIGIVATTVNILRISKWDAATGSVLHEYKEMFNAKKNAFHELYHGGAAKFTLRQFEGIPATIELVDESARMTFTIDGEMAKDVDVALKAGAILQAIQARVEKSCSVVVVVDLKSLGRDDRINRAVRDCYRALREMVAHRGYSSRSTASAAAPRAGGG